MFRMVLVFFFLVLSVDTNARNHDLVQMPRFPHEEAGEAKTAATTSRLIAKTVGMANSAGGLDFSDSTAYIYSGNRGGDLKSEKIPFDSQLYFIQGGLYEFHTNQYNAAGQADTSVYGNLHLFPPAYARSAFTYNSSGGLDIEIIQVWRAGPARWENATRAIYDYHPDGTVFRVEVARWDNALKDWKTTGRTTYTYSAGRLTEKLIEHEAGGSWEGDQRTTATYDAAGNELTYMQESALTTGWQADWRYTRYYNGAVKVGQVYEQQGAFGLERRDSSAISYTGTAPVTRTTLNFMFQSGVWAARTRITEALNGIGDLVTKRTQDWDVAASAWKDKQRYFYFYNSYDQLTREYSESRLPDTSWGRIFRTDYERRYYYEQDATTIAERGNPPAADIRLSPVPARDALNMDVSVAGGGPFSAAITDISGKVLLSWKGEARPGYSKRLDIRSLPPGMYHVSVLAKGIRGSKAFVVQR